MLLVNKADQNLLRLKDSNEKKYVTASGNVYSNMISKLPCILDNLSNGCVFRRMQKIFPYIFIDEIQDFAGYDLEVIKKLHEVGCHMILVGDPRQTTYRTHYETFRGWCTEKKDFRLFKLNRMDAVLKEYATFIPREVPMPNLSDEKIFPGGIKVKALFTRDSQWRLVEEFGIHCFTENEDGTLLFTADYTEKENLLSWLLTFGDKVKVLEPAWVQEELIRIAKNIIKAYDAQN